MMHEVEIINNSICKKLLVKLSLRNRANQTVRDCTDREPPIILSPSHPFILYTHNIIRRVLSLKLMAGHIT